MRKNLKGEKIAFILYIHTLRNNFKIVNVFEKQVSVHILICAGKASELPTQKVISLFKAHRMNIYAGIKTEKVRTAKN